MEKKVSYSYCFIQILRLSIFSISFIVFNSVLCFWTC